MNPNKVEHGWLNARGQNQEVQTNEVYMITIEQWDIERNVLLLWSGHRSPQRHIVCWSVCKLVRGLGVILKMHICMYHTFSTSNTCFSF